jgi:hypothetical protein
MPNISKTVCLIFFLFCSTSLSFFIHNDKNKSHRLRKLCSDFIHNLETSISKKKSMGAPKDFLLSTYEI